ncbi:SMI1/KNR4 family protein [Streptomyces sp. NPDC001633]|uniref:SMI1/KNR4 family protein n=1 Tax=Streptomyces sp. NPDC001633 TaxID=3364595 RepID=UPI00369D2C8E
MPTGRPQARLVEVVSTVWPKAVAALPSTAVFQPRPRSCSLIRCAPILGHPLPGDLAALLRESNGVEGDDGEGFIWSTERITSENERLREDAELASLYMPFGSLLFFTDAGNGDLFALLPASTGPMSSSGTTRTTATPGVVPLVCDGSSCLGVI